MQEVPRVLVQDRLRRGVDVARGVVGAPRREVDVALGFQVVQVVRLRLRAAAGRRRRRERVALRRQRVYLPGGPGAAER